jgi:putative endonuclease
MRATGSEGRSSHDRPHTQRPRPAAAGDETSPVDRSRIARGRWGEDLAAAHYERLGYEILDRNWRSSTGEIDLVVERDRVVVFSEVKTRTSDRYGPPGAAVDRAKQRRIRILAIEWLEAHQRRRDAIRFDVVAITGVRIELIESAF